MSIKKTYLKSKPVCKVEFRVAQNQAENAAQIHIVGEFNNWGKKATPMKKLKKGDFVATISLEPGREYEFRYLIDNTKWTNELAADRFVYSAYGDCDNSVLCT